MDCPVVPFKPLPGVDPPFSRIVDRIMDLHTHIDPDENHLRVDS